jgi:hypothetical protein
MFQLIVPPWSRFLNRRIAAGSWKVLTMGHRLYESHWGANRVDVDPFFDGPVAGASKDSPGTDEKVNRLWTRCKATQRLP